MISCSNSHIRLIPSAELTIVNKLITNHFSKPDSMKYRKYGTSVAVKIHPEEAEERCCTR